MLPENNDEEHYAEAPMGDLRKQLDALARELVAQTDVNDAALANAKPSAAHDQGQPTPLFPAPTPVLPKLPDTASSWPLTGDHRGTSQQRQSGLSQDDLDLALLELRSSMGMVPELPGERGRKSWASARFWFCAVAGVAALAASIVVLSGTRPVMQKAKQDAPLIAMDRNNDSSQAAAEVAREPNQTDKVKEPVPPPESIAVTPPAAPSSPLQAASIHADASPVAATPSPSPQGTSVETNAAPVSAPQSSPPPAPTIEAGAAPSAGPPSPPTQAANTFSGSRSSPPQVASIEIQQGPGSGLESPRAHGASTIAHLNDDEITALINHAKDFLRNGDFVSARLLLRRAAEAGSVDATLMLGETFDPLVMHERGAIGIAPDIAQATQWYEKAAKLGSDIATQRLAKLAQTGH